MNHQQSPISDDASTKLRIFLVEDVPAVRELIVTSLADLDEICWSGFADSENDACTQLRDHDCDILIVDIELKQGNGMNLLRRLMQEDTQKESLKIIFSNNVCDAYRRAGRQYGVEHFFDKTLELPKLRALLTNKLHGNQS